MECVDGNQENLFAPLHYYGELGWDDSSGRSVGFGMPIDRKFIYLLKSISIFESDERNRQKRNKKSWKFRNAARHEPRSLAQQMYVET